MKQLKLETWTKKKERLITHSRMYIWQEPIMILFDICFILENRHLEAELWQR